MRPRLLSRLLHLIHEAIFVTTKAARLFEWQGLIIPYLPIIPLIFMWWECALWQWNPFASGVTSILLQNITIKYSISHAMSVLRPLLWQQKPFIYCHDKNLIFHSSLSFHKSLIFDVVWACTTKGIVWCSFVNSERYSVVHCKTGFWYRTLNTSSLCNRTDGMK